MGFAAHKWSESDISRGMKGNRAGGPGELQMRVFWREWNARITTGRHAAVHRRLDELGGSWPPVAADVGIIRMDVCRGGGSHARDSRLRTLLFAEAELLDRMGNWPNGWLSSMRSGAASTSPRRTCPDADPNTSLYLIADDMTRLRTRVEQLLSGLTWAERNPKSRTNHMVTNVRIARAGGDALLVRANFVVFRMRFQNVDPYIGKYYYKLLPQDGTFKILERRAVLDLEALRPHGLG